MVTNDAAASLIIVNIVSKSDQSLSSSTTKVKAVEFAEIKQGGCGYYRSCQFQSAVQMTRLQQLSSPSFPRDHCTLAIKITSFISTDSDSCPAILQLSNIAGSRSGGCFRHLKSYYSTRSTYKLAITASSFGEKGLSDGTTASFKWPGLMSKYCCFTAACATAYQAYQIKQQMRIDGSSALGLLSSCYRLNSGQPGGSLSWAGKKFSGHTRYLRLEAPPPQWLANC